MVYERRVLDIWVNYNIDIKNQNEVLLDSENISTNKPSIGLVFHVITSDNLLLLKTQSSIVLNKYILRACYISSQYGENTNKMAREQTDKAERSHAL